MGYQIRLERADNQAFAADQSRAIAVQLADETYADANSAEPLFTYSIGDADIEVEMPRFRIHEVAKVLERIAQLHNLVIGPAAGSLARPGQIDWLDVADSEMRLLTRIGNEVRMEPPQSASRVTSRAPLTRALHLVPEAELLPGFVMPIQQTEWDDREWKRLLADAQTGSVTRRRFIALHTGGWPRRPALVKLVRELLADEDLYVKGAAAQSLGLLRDHASSAQVTATWRFLSKHPVEDSRFPAEARLEPALMAALGIAFLAGSDSTLMSELRKDLVARNIDKFTADGVRIQALLRLIGS